MYVSSFVNGIWLLVEVLVVDESFGCRCYYVVNVYYIDKIYWIWQKSLVDVGI